MKHKVCDMHSHIVPLVDDGASNIEMSIEMLRSAYKQGAKHIVCTSHSNGNMRKYAQSLKELQNVAKKENIDVAIHSGCEIYCNVDNISDVVRKLNNGEILTIDETNYILVEFNPYTPAKEILYCINFLQAYNYNIIIAHVERYYSLSKESKWVKMLHKMECLFQINVYSVQDEKDIQIKTFARKLLEEKYVTFIGSDAHRTNHRPYMIKNGIDYIYANCDVEYADNVCYKNSMKILN